MKFKLSVGDYRHLTSEEKKKCPKYKYATCVECSCIINNKKITIPKGFLTDGSTGGPDIGWSWLFHDYLYFTHVFDDGSECTQKQADKIMYDLLTIEKRYLYRTAFSVVNKIFNFVFKKHWRKRGGPEFLTDNEKIIRKNFNF